MPRESHAEFARASDRDPVGLILGQATSRVPELVPIRHGRMLVSPFTFYRGAALPMAADLPTTPTSGLRVQLCGDAHLSNFGAFASPERRLVFDLNDFDETLPGPVRVGRQAARREPRRRRARQRVRRQGARRTIVLAGVAAYRTAMREFADSRCSTSGTPTSTSRTRAPVSFKSQLRSERSSRPRSALAKARTRDSMQALSKLTTVGRRPAADHQRPAADRAGRGAVRRTAGRRDLRRSSTGCSASTAARCSPTAGTCSSSSGWSTWPARWSVSAASAPGPGSCCWRPATSSEPLFLQAKEAQPSVLADYCGTQQVRQPGRSGSSPASTSCRRPATSSSAGNGRPGRTASSATTTSASCATGSSPCRIEEMTARRAWRSTRACAAGRWPGPTPAPATGSPSPPTSALRQLRPRDRRVRRDLRRPERARPCRACQAAVASGRAEAVDGL